MSIDPTKPKADDRPISPIMWRCRHCNNVAGNFSHRDTCAFCGETKPGSVAA